MPGIDRMAERLENMGLPAKKRALAGSSKTLPEICRAGSSLLHSIRVLGYGKHCPIMEVAIYLSKAGGITVFEAW